MISDRLIISADSTEEMLFLKQVCAFLCSVGPKENVYRYSGDEFALLFINDRGERVRQCVLDIEARMRQRGRTRITSSSFR